MDLNIGVPEDQIRELARALNGNETRLRKYAAQAMNRAVRKGATQVRREVAKAIGLPVRKLGSNTGKGRKGMIRPLLASPEHLDARIRLLNFNLKMIDTRREPNAGGSYPLGRYADPVPLEHGPFKQTMHSGHLGWFVRYGEPRKMLRGTYEGRVREPIKEIYTSSPRKVMESDSSLMNLARGLLQRYFNEELEKLVQRHFKKALT